MTAQTASMGNSALILCVEDEEVLRRDIVEELCEAGYRVIEAATGEEALAQCRATRPDLILCDISMPGMNGYDVLRELRRQPDGFVDIPFLFLSALADRKQVVEGKLLGADDYLTKPVDFDLLLATVHTRLRQITRLRDQIGLSDGDIEAQLRALADPDHNSNNAGITAILDLISTAIVLVGSGRRISFINRAAQGLIESYQLLRAAFGNCTAQSGSKTGFSGWLEQLLTQDGGHSVSSFSLYDDEQNHELKIVGCRLEGESAASLGAALFIAPAGKPSELSPAPLEAMFGFTPTESLIAAGLAKGEKPAEIAASLNIAQTTVAFHIRNIFQKTGVSRQASLVALLLTSPAGLL